MDRTRVREFHVSDSRNLGKPFQTSMMYFASFCGYYTTVRLGRNCLSLGRRRNKIIVCDYSDSTLHLASSYQRCGTRVASRARCAKNSGMSVMTRSAFPPLQDQLLSQNTQRGHQTQTDSKSGWMRMRFWVDFRM